METIGHRIKRLRKEKKMSQDQLGDMVGVKQTAVSGWENDKNYLDRVNLKKLAEVLQVKLKYLEYGEEEYQQKSQNISTPVINEPLAEYGITKDELIEFYKWKAEKATQEAETAIKQVERLKSTSVDAN